MSSRLQNAGLIGLLVLTMVVVGFALRQRPVDPSSSTTSATSTSTPTAQPSASPSPTTSAASTVVFIGDSFTAGKGAVPENVRWTTLLTKELELTEVNLGAAGTGYLRAGKGTACDGKPCPAFKDLVAKAVEAKPSVVIVAGGANDLGLPLADVKTAVTDTVKGLREGLPNAQVLVVTPWWDSRPESAQFTDLVETVRKAAVDGGATYADTGQPFTGHSSLLTNGEANNKGHKALEQAVLKAIQQPGSKESPSAAG